MIDKIDVGTVVICTDEYYEGLIGVITEVKTDKSQFETENDTPIEITVDLDETDDMEFTHPDLNGTSVDSLFMCYDELIYFFDGIDNPGVDYEGNKFDFSKVINKYKNYINEASKRYL